MRKAALPAVLGLALLAVTVERRMTFAFPRPSGPFPVGVTTLTLARETAGGIEPGSYEVQLWYPGRASDERAPYGTAEPGLRSLLYRRLLRSHAAPEVALADASERFPVIVYIAGWGGRRTDNTILAEDLASHGFVVAALSDPSQDRPSPGELGGAADFSSENAYRASLDLARRRLAYQARRASRVLDALQALDAHDPARRFTGRLRTRDAGVLGYSFGGAVALEACNVDARFAAAANIDGWLFGVRNARKRPYLLVSDNAPFPTAADLDSPDPEHRFESILTVEDDAVQKAALAFDGDELVVDGATHLDFTDAPSYSASSWYRRPAVDPKRMAHILTRYVTGFFAEKLRGDPSPLFVEGVTLDPAATLTHAGLERRARQGSAS